MNQYNQNNKYSLFRIANLSILQFLIAVFVLIIPTISLLSQQTGGGYSQAYLFRDVSARVNAMSGAYTAIVNEPTAIFYNPAGVGFLTDRPIVITSFSALGFNRNQSSISWAQEISPGIGLGAGLNSFFSGEFTGRDSRGNALGEFAEYQHSLVVAAAYRLESSSMGIAVKYMNTNLTGTSTNSNGFAFDLGTKFHILDLFSFGLAVQNISGMMFWNNDREDIELIPYNIRTGLAMEFAYNASEYQTRSTVTGELEWVYEPATRYLLIGLDAVVTQHRKTPDIILGLEAALHEIIAFRAGMCLYGENLGSPQLVPLTKWGGGVSLRPQLANTQMELPFNMNIDYTITPEYLSQSGITHHISLVFEF